MDEVLWRPSQTDLTQSQMAQFLQFVSNKTSLKFADYFELQKWSVDQKEDFWSLLWDFCKISGEKNMPILKNPNDLEHSVWFENAKLNFTENLLCRRDEHPALLSIREEGSFTQMSYSRLYEEVAILQDYFFKQGLKVGDRVAVCLPNRAETIVIALAAASMGMVFSSCSPDFAVASLLDRFNQIRPKILFVTDFHQYNGKEFSHYDDIDLLQKNLEGLEKVILVPYKNEYKKIKNIPVFSEILVGNAKSFSELILNKFPFNHPLYILYSSGTTGRPKCMVHGAGGTLLQHAKELILHVGLHSKDKLFFFTTCGWMMWNWLVSGLKVGATLILYEGSPMYPNANRFFDLIDEHEITILGVGAKYVESCEKQKFIPKKTHSLKSLKTILTTGSPLLPESFDYLHDKVSKTARISSISGGSDIISCFALGNPILPVYRGQLQCLGLGMAVKVFNEAGKSILEETGELVCTKSFPSKPIYFWNDPEGKKFHKAYFSQFPNVWAHGDFAELTKEGGLIIRGRSDATLNPGGIRIGTAEIYGPLEKIPEITDYLAVGQEWEGSERIILFIVLAPNQNLDEALHKKIKSNIRENTSPHHLPAKIIAVPDLPRTLNGKLAELAVKNIIHHRPVKNHEALLNPDVLNYFQNLDELK